MEMNKREYSEVRINHIDEERNVAFIDGWFTCDDNEEGVVIGEIDLATNKITSREGYEYDILTNHKVVEAVTEFLNEHPIVEDPRPQPKQLLCACCKRPFRPNIGCYNFPDVGATCIDCVDRVKRFYRVKENDLKLQSYVARYMRECGSHNCTATAEVIYEKDSHMPFRISVGIGKWSDYLSLTTLDDVKAIHSALGKFIAECKI